MKHAQQSDRDWEYCQLVLTAAILAYRPLYLTELAVVSGLPGDIFAGHANTDRVRELVVLC
jgi:hypothetical protein